MDPLKDPTLALLEHVDKIYGEGDAQVARYGKSFKGDEDAHQIGGTT